MDKYRLRGRFQVVGLMRSLATHGGQFPHAGAKGTEWSLSLNEQMLRLPDSLTNPTAFTQRGQNTRTHFM